MEHISPSLCIEIILSLEEVVTGLVNIHVWIACVSGSVRPKKLTAVITAEITAVITAEMLRQYFPLTVNRPKELFSAETAIFGRNKPVSA